MKYVSALLDIINSKHEKKYGIKEQTNLKDIFQHPKENRRGNEKSRILFILLPNILWRIPGERGDKP
jgi:hypothetical protein